MAKFYGIVGYAATGETVDGVWKENPIMERPYFGDVVRNYKRSQSGGNLNDDVSLSNEISIVADPFAYQHCYAIRYVDYMGVRWKVESVEVERPRLILSLGGVYNE